MIADYHFHPSFKAFLSDIEPAKKAGSWKPIHFLISRLWKKQNRILDSQCCFEQVKAGGVSLAVIPLYSLEKAFTASFLLQLVAMFSPHADLHLFTAIRKGKLTYYTQLQQSLEHLLKSRDEADPQGYLNFLTTPQPPSGMLDIFLSVEGGHCFVEEPGEINSPQGIRDICKRLEDLKRKDQPTRLLHLNLTHLTQYVFCNHAFGMKIINQEDFKPVGNGITPLGYALIDTALSTTGSEGPVHRIFIDIKHMSLKSRQQYYAHIKAHHSGDYRNGKLPIIASHVGVTGFSWSKVDDYIIDIQHSLQNKGECVYVDYRLPQGKGGACFNPWSINLYDEDIVEVLLSGGLIGLSLDQRILGCGGVAKEKMSLAEFKTQVKIRTTQLFDDNEPHIRQDSVRHFRALCNNICHIIQVSRSIQSFHPIDAWKHICIASDFDGLIDPIDGCCEASQMYLLRDALRTHLPTMIADYGLSLGDVDAKINGIVYKNAYTFITNKYS
jgi:microsomal dipeptidase-like Zn-dependent dipeptidase